MGGREGPFSSTKPEKVDLLVGRSKVKFHSPNLSLFLKHLAPKQWFSTYGS